MMNFLNHNAGAFSVLFSAVVAVATVMYAILTVKIVAETEKMRRLQTTPKIFINIEPREEWINLIDLRIANKGLGPAYDIKFKISPDFELFKGHHLGDLGCIKKGLKHLAPGQEMRFFLTNMAEDTAKKIKTIIEISVSYKDLTKLHYEDHYVINFSELAGLPQHGLPPLYSIANFIERIENHFNEFAHGILELEANAKSDFPQGCDRCIEVIRHDTTEENIILIENHKEE